MFKWTLLIFGIVCALSAVGHSASYDPIVTYIESQFGVHPGDPLPQDWRTPNIRFQYKGATSVGDGCYQVHVCRFR